MAARGGQLFTHDYADGTSVDMDGSTTSGKDDYGDSEEVYFTVLGLGWSYLYPCFFVTLWTPAVLSPFCFFGFPW